MSISKKGISDGETVMRDLQDKGEVESCEVCGGKFWIYWYADKSKNKRIMSKCGPCFFGSR